MLGVITFTQKQGYSRSQRFVQDRSKSNFQLLRCPQVDCRAQLYQFPKVVLQLVEGDLVI